MKLTYKTYNIDGLGTIRTAMENGETWFYVTDVLRAINVSASAALSVRNSAVLSAYSRKIRDNVSNLIVWVINADGIYKYISKRAVRFNRDNTNRELALQKWVNELNAGSNCGKQKYKTIRSLAKDMNIGCRKLYRKLLNDNIVELVDGVLLPTQQTKQSGLMALVITRDIYDAQYNVSSYVTDKGYKYFVEKYSRVG